MNKGLPLSKEKKLTVHYKMEPGCLGPKGVDLAESFCSFAQQQMLGYEGDFVSWEIKPRFDKSLPEIQYRVNNKELLPRMVEKYLAVFGKDVDSFEEAFNNRLTELIELFMAR